MYTARQRGKATGWHKAVAASLFVLALTSGSKVGAQIAQWTFETSQPSNAGPHNAEVGTGIARGLHASGGTVYSAPAGNGSARSFSSTAWAAGDYYQFSFSTTGLQGISISFDQTGSNTGPKTFQVQTSINGSTYTTLAGSNYDITNDGWSMNTPSSVPARTINLPASLDNQATVFVRLTVAAGSTAINGNPIAAAGTSRIDNVSVTNSGVLPVTLSMFKATAQAGDILLSWSTVMEKNVNYFSIERSMDGEHFSAIGRVTAFNQSNGADYTFTDLSAPDVAAYYRLKTVDFDGQTEYSRIVSVKGNTSLSGVNLEANPVRNVLPLSFPAKTVAELYIVNLAGTVWQHQTVSNATMLNWDISSLPAGMYLLQVKGANSRETLKFIKQ